jgi:hypothetical protein
MAALNGHLVELTSAPLVTMLGNRACLTDEVVAELPAHLRQWVRDNCERVHLVDVWLLPVPKDHA